jgi:hypothetical protein
MRAVFLFLLMITPAPAAAQTIVTSPEPSSVSVSLYRDQNRDADTKMDLDYLGGFALITETRQVDLPPGEVVIRFEGVASGIQPESAIVLGAPLKEKNRDRQLLSQRGLLDAFTGQSVTVKRTNRATGVVTEEPAIIRSAPDRLILQTASGYEAIYCSGLNDTLLFPGVPKGLTAKPTLSVTTKKQPGGKQTITLSYLASNFDWQANYVAEMAPDAKSVNLLAWMTMASADETSFTNANTFAVAGELERGEVQSDEDSPYARDNIEIGYSCYPLNSTTDALRRRPSPVLAQPPMPSAMMSKESAEDMEIVVTGARMAVQEDIGDLKLYRIPFPVTVAAQSQKQVAFLNKKNVAGEVIYKAVLSAGNVDDIKMLYRVQNIKESGLGEALPAGKIAFFQKAAGRRMLVGQASTEDKAMGEEVEFEFAEASNVTAETDQDFDDGGKDKKWESYVLEVKNANPFAITFESEIADFDNDEYRYFKLSGATFRKKGKTIWRTTVPANGSSKLSFRNELKQRK